MRVWLARGLCATLVAAGLTASLSAPAHAQVPIWQMATVTSAPKAISRNYGTVEFTVKCPVGMSALSGWVNPPAEGDDLRLIQERANTGPSEGDYYVVVGDFSGLNGTINITASARCVSNFVLGNITRVNNLHNQFPVDNSTHLAEGTVNCPSGMSAVSARQVGVGPNAGATLLTSTPTANLQGWHAAGYHDDVNQDLYIEVNCAAADKLSGLRLSYTTTSVSQWGAPASATCLPGLVPTIGGTWDVSANPDALSVYSRPTATGWTSTTLTLGTASIFTVVFCLPESQPTVTLNGSSGLTSTPSAAWTFSGSDPAAAGGYQLSYRCVHVYITPLPPFYQSTPQNPCTSPVQMSNMPDGQHDLLVYARTSDGRESDARLLTVRVDTVDPTVVFQKQAGFAFSTTSPVIDFTSADPLPASGMTLNECWLDSAAPAPCTSNPNSAGTHSEQLSNLSPGAHTMHVRVSDAAGNQATYDLAFTVDTDAPTVVFQTPAESFFKTDSPGIAYTSADPGSGVTLNECWLDDATPATCTQAPNTGGARTEQLSGVSQGAHTLHVRATDAAGNQATGDLAFTVDTTAPTTTMTKPNVPITVSRAVTALWSGTDAVSGLQSFSVRSRRAPFNSGFAAFSTPITTPAATTSRVYGSLVLGSTYCWSARATDNAGNPAASWSSERCTAIPLDDRQLTRSAGWTASTPTGWLQNTALSTSTQGAALSMSGVVLKRVGVVALTCPTCGRIAITVKGVEVGQINLAASTTSRRLKTLPVFSLRSGQVAIKVLSDGKPVRIDALAVSRL